MLALIAFTGASLPSALVPHSGTLNVATKTNAATRNRSLLAKRSLNITVSDRVAERLAPLFVHGRSRHERNLIVDHRSAV